MSFLWDFPSNGRCEPAEAKKINSVPGWGPTICLPLPLWLDWLSVIFLQEGFDAWYRQSTPIPQNQKH